MYSKLYLDFSSKVKVKCYQGDLVLDKLSDSLNV